MEQVQRVLLYFALLMVSLLLWNAWKKDFPTQPEKQITAVQETQRQIPTPGPVAGPTIVQPKPVTTQLKTPAEKLIQVRTDLFNVSIDPRGGKIVSLSLPKYPKTIKTPDEPFQLLTDVPELYYLANSGILGGPQGEINTFTADFTAAQNNYVLNPGKDFMQVELNWENTKGLKITKIFTFTRDEYLIHITYKIENTSNNPINVQLINEITRKNVKPKSSHLFEIHPYFGAAISSPEEHYQKVTFSEMEQAPLQTQIQNGWAAMVQRYFLSAWVPNPTDTYTYYSKVENDFYTIGMASPVMTVTPNTSQTVAAKFYAGPEIASRLEKIAPNLQLTISYGWLWFISVIIFWVMDKIYFVVGNWGWAIIIVTVLIKLMFYHLSAKSYQSMARMRDLQPKIQSLRERYADDKQKQSQAMMELYKKEKVNPIGGCLPILVQIPVFFALYMVLIESVQLRQAPWILWIHDLSAPDPYFILPIIMGISMFVQQKLNPPPPDPTQAKVMMFLPVVFTVLFAYFPAGLVLYWAVNNILSVAQQWYITSKYQQKK